MDAFYALAEPNRRRIIQILARNGQLTATEICDNFRISPQAVSQHLKVLLDSRLLRMERHAQRRIYEINTDSISDMEKWLESTKRQWDRRLDRLDSLLKEDAGKSKS